MAGRPDRRRAVAGAGSARCRPRPRRTCTKPRVRSSALHRQVQQVEHRHRVDHAAVRHPVHLDRPELVAAPARGQPEPIPLHRAAPRPEHRQHVVPVGVIPVHRRQQRRPTDAAEGISDRGVEGGDGVDTRHGAERSRPRERGIGRVHRRHGSRRVLGRHEAAQTGDEFPVHAPRTMAVISSSTTSSGSINREISTKLHAGRMSAKTSPWARPTACQSPMSVR